MLRGLIRWSAELEGWRRSLIAALLGALGTAAMPPWHILPALLPSIVGLVWLLQYVERPRHGFSIGWFWGLGHFTTGCYWIIEAYFVPPADFAALGPPMVLGLAMLLAVFLGTACLAVCLIVARWPERWVSWRFVLLFCVAFSIAEWLRSWVLTGFPWNPLGHVWAFSDPLLQSASLWGIWGLGLVTAVLFALPALAVDDEHPGRGALVGVLLPLVVAVSLYAAGAWRLGATAVADSSTFVRLVQPNVAQGEKWRVELQSRHLAHLMGLSIGPRGAPQAAITHVIWPETAIPFLLNEAPEILRRLATVVPEGGYLITGAPRTTSDPMQRNRDGRQPVWNSLLVVDSNGQVRATYDKAHLVPFGEYLPFHDVLPLLADTIGRGSFNAGKGPDTIAVPGLPAFAPIICYETIFPAALVGATRPAWLLNITNDSWFGHSAGPYQHLVSARLRSIEEGLPMARVANTGISAVIDPMGRVVASLGIDLPGTIDRAVPLPLPETMFAKFRLAGWLALAAVLFLIGWLTPASLGRKDKV